jgi:hypothetical protein
MRVEIEHVAQRPAVADDHVVQLVLRRDLGVLHLGPVDVAHRRHAGVDDVVEVGVDVTGEIFLGHELHDGHSGCEPPRATQNFAGRNKAASRLRRPAGSTARR